MMKTALQLKTTRRSTKSYQRRFCNHERKLKKFKPLLFRKKKNLKTNNWRVLFVSKIEERTTDLEERKK
jgi:hypothetical protein